MVISLEKVYQNEQAIPVDFNGSHFAGACYDTYYSNALAGRVKLESYYKVPASQVIDKMQVKRRNGELVL